MYDVACRTQSVCIIYATIYSTYKFKIIDSMKRKWKICIKTNQFSKYEIMLNYYTLREENVIYYGKAKRFSFISQNVIT